MKKSRFTEEQIVGILRETDRDAVATVAKRHGVSEQAIYTSRKRFGAFQPDDVRRRRQLECDLEIERRRRKLQRQVPRRMPEHGMVPLSRPGPFNTVLEGTIEEAGDAGSLKLTVIRRTGAGQEA